MDLGVVRRWQRPSEIAVRVDNSVKRASTGHFLPFVISTRAPEPSIDFVLIPLREMQGSADVDADQNVRHRLHGKY